MRLVRRLSRMTGLSIETVISDLREDYAAMEESVRS
jgi:hypothetical protein